MNVREIHIQKQSIDQNSCYAGYLERQLANLVVEQHLREVCGRPTSEAPQGDQYDFRHSSRPSHGGKLVLRTMQYEQLSATLALPMGYVYLCIPISGLLIVFYQLLILKKPQQFRAADEVEVALEHIAEEERKLASGEEK